MRESVEKENQGRRGVSFGGCDLCDIHFNEVHDLNSEEEGQADASRK